GQLLSEFAAESSDATVAYRRGHRWIQSFDAIRLEEVSERPPRLREYGVYVITGGLGGIGLELAAYLARSVQSRIVLVGRSTFPQKAEWGQWLETHGDEDEVSVKIRRVQALEEQGAEVMIACADVANQQQMQEVVNQAHERFGAIHGVIH